MTEPTVNDLNVARAHGTLAANAGDSRDSCLWGSGPMRDAWLEAYDRHAGEPLLKVLDAGGPLGLAADAGGPL
jgi:ribosome modulation factor